MSAHPLLELVPNTTVFDENAAFFAQPVEPFRAARILAVGRQVLPSTSFRPIAKMPTPGAVIGAAEAAASLLAPDARDAILREFAHRPIAPEPGAGERSTRLITRSFAFPERPPYWMGRSYELAPCERLIAGSLVLMDADVKGAGPTIAALRRDDPRLDGLLSLDEAQAELFFADLLFYGGVRGSITAYILTTPELPDRQIEGHGPVRSAVLVRWMREERRVSNLAAYDVALRERVWRYCAEKLAASGDIESAASPTDYLVWFCLRMAENAARLARLGVLHSALHPQNVTLAAEVVDHGMTTLVPDWRPSDLGAALDHHQPSREEETFRNQPGRLLVCVRSLRDQLAAFAPEVSDAPITKAFVERFHAALAQPTPARCPPMPPSAFDLLETQSWFFGPPEVG